MQPCFEYSVYNINMICLFLSSTTKSKLYYAILAMLQKSNLLYCSVSTPPPHTHICFESLHPSCLLGSIMQFPIHIFIANSQFKYGKVTRFILNNHVTLKIKHNCSNTDLWILLVFAVKKESLFCSYTGRLSVHVCFPSISSLCAVLKFLPTSFCYYEDYFLSFTQPNPQVPLMFSSEHKFSKEPFQTPNPQTTLLIS